MKRSFIVGILFILFINNLSGQDPQFSQFYASSLYLNPAFAGLGEQGRAGLIYRNQWPSLETGFETFAAWGDYNFDEYNSGVGFMIVTDREGLAGLRSTSINAIYSYQLNLNYNWAFRPAVQASYFFRDVNFDKLTFGDQFSPNGEIINPTGENFGGPTVNFFDLTFGGLAYTNRLWIGVTVSHVTEPNQSFNDEEVSPLPRKLSIHAGYKIPISLSIDGNNYGPEKSITPSFNFRSQAEFDQLDLGVYFTYEPVIFGLWYRGVPTKTVSGFANNESIVFLAGMQRDELTFGYSFDLTISELGLDSGGAHEFSLIYRFKLDPSKPPRDVRSLKCPIPFIF